MKKMMLILAMLLIAATAYNQTSRKTANTNTTATKEKQDPMRRSSTPAKRSSHENRAVTTERNDQNSRATRPENTRATQSRENHNSSTQRSTSNSNARQVENRNTGRADNYPANQNQTSRPTVTRRPEVVVYESPRVYRETHRVYHHYSSPPPNREYRATHYVYHRPVGVEVYWTPVIHRNFIRIYPMVPYWHYNTGYRIEMVSSYDAIYYQGDVMTVYGRISEVFYSRATDEYFMYFGPYYPYQDFTVVMPGYLARRYSHRPERLFSNHYIAVTGLITSFNGEPEMVVKELFQINLY